MKIKYNSDDNLPLRKMLELFGIITVVKSVFHFKFHFSFHFQFFEQIIFISFFKWIFLQINWVRHKYWGVMELLLHKTESWLVAWVLHLSLLVPSRDFWFQRKVCDGCNNITQTSMSFNDVAVCSIRGNHYITQFWFMTNRETE